jgi:hypothetical protein
MATGLEDRKLVKTLTAAWNGTGAEPSNTTATLNHPGMGTASFQIGGAGSSTLTWEASVNGSVFESIPAMKLSTGVKATTATATGIYLVPAAAFQYVRARCSTYVADVTVTAISSVADFASTVASTAPSGGGSATSPTAVRLADGTVFTDTVGFATVNTTQSPVIASAERVVADIEIQSAVDNATNRVRAAKDMITGVAGGSMIGAALGVYDSVGLTFKPAKGFADGTLLSGGFTTIITSTLTRAATTTAYTAGDEMSNSDSVIRTITGAARFSGGTGVIMGVYVSQDHLWTTKPSMEIWVYDTTGSPAADNDPFAPSDAETDSCIAVIPVTATYAGTINQALDSGPINIPFLTVGSANLFFRVVIRNAAQDSANSGVTKFRFRIAQD